MKMIALFILSCTLSFSNIVDNTLQYEGDRVVRDKHEYSKYGITHKLLEVFNDEYDTFWEVGTLTYNQARVVAVEMIYRKNRVHEINDDKNKAAVFDFLFNSGGSRKVIQTVLNDYVLAERRSGNWELDYIDVDGVIGTKTIELINIIPRQVFINNLTNARLGYVRKLPNYAVNKNGWENRIRTISDKV